MYGRKDGWDVAHNWANDSNGTGIGAGGNMLYGGGCIYSYGDHFMIAKQVRNEKGERAVLFTERSYSQTTSRHIATVRSAASHLNIINVADPALDAAALFDDWYTRLVHLASQLPTAKKPGKWLLQIESVFHEAKRYADFFGCALPEKLAAAGAVRTGDQYFNMVAKASADKAAEEAAERKKQQKAQTLRLKKWRVFEAGQFRDPDGWDYLRYNSITSHIETTQRVTIPIAEARPFFELINRTIAVGGCQNCGTKFMQQYDVLDINAKFIRVGCHQISMKEINRMAKIQGWL